MTEHGWQDVKEIFLNALEKDAEERESFLDEVCNGDGSQRAELESLLKSHFEVEGFIETPAFKIGEVFDGGTVARDQQFGNYTIIREIGVGGMGAVFLAKRSDGEFDQMVAIKIVRQAIAESHLIDRFKRERQILAPLNHPNIARLLDGGVSQNGQPFLAMEYVEGDTITRFSEQQDLSIREKIILFLKVCSAVSYAHRNLIVHRDLKPNNILVTADGEPKLLDFGLAKLLDASLNSDAEQTQTAFRALTPAYASPEQLRGEPITTASDIYSLGVVLFELLTGERPLKTDGKSLEEIIRTATEFEPTLPSRSTPSGAQLKGDLDNIALTALRREPERRYRSVEQFSDDLERYLDGRPVSARPNTFRYRASKFVQRNRIVVAAASLILAIITVGVGTTIWQARQTRKEKEKAENINTFLEQTLRYSNPILSPLKKSGQDTTVNEVLDEAARRLESGEFDHDPELKIELERTVATTLLGQGQYLRGRRHMAEYVALLRQVYSENDPKFVIGMTYSAGLLFAKGEMVEAEALYRQNLPTLRTEVTRGTINPGVLADALNNFAYLRRTQGDSHEAEMLFRETLDIVPNLTADEQLAVATTRSTLASTIRDQGRFDEALSMAQLAVNENISRSGTDAPTYAFALNILGGFQSEKGDYAQADATLASAEAIIRKFMSPANLWLGDNQRNQAISFYGQGKFAQAIEKADVAAKLYEENFGKHYDHYPTVLIYKGLSLAKSGKLKEGEALLLQAAEIRNETLPAEHYWVAAANSALGECLTMERQYPEAEDLLRKSFDSLKISQEPNNPLLELARMRLISLYDLMGKPDLSDQLRR